MTRTQSQRSGAPAGLEVSGKPKLLSRRRLSQGLGARPSALPGHAAEP